MENKLNGSFLIGFGVVVGLLFSGGLFEMHPIGEAKGAFRINTLTGSVSICSAAGCKKVKEN